MLRLLLVALLIREGLFPVHVSAQTGFDDLSSATNPQNQALKKPLITLHGRVVDARTGEPLAKVKVIAGGGDQSNTTDENGSFTLENLPVG